MRVVGVGLIGRRMLAFAASCCLRGLSESHAMKIPKGFDAHKTTKSLLDVAGPNRRPNSKPRSPKWPGFVFVHSKENMQRAKAFAEYVDDRRMAMKSKKLAFFDAIASVSLSGLSIAEASERHNVRPMALASSLKHITTESPAEVFARIIHREVTALLWDDITPGEKHKSDRQFVHYDPGVQSDTIPSPARLNRYDAPEVERSSQGRGEVDGNDEDAIFDSFIDYRAGLEPLASPIDTAHTPLAPPMRIWTPPAKQAPPTFSVPDAASVFALTRSVSRSSAIAPEDAVDSGPSQSAAARDAARPRSVADFVAAPRMVYVTHLSLAAVHQEFLSLAVISVNRVHADKMGLFHAMVDMCHGVALDQAAHSKFLSVNVLEGAMTALHASSPLDVLLWLTQPSTAQTLSLPGGFAKAVLRNDYSALAPAQLMEQRFGPHAVTYHQHPLGAWHADHPLWLANQVGAQPMMQR